MLFIQASFAILLSSRPNKKDLFFDRCDVVNSPLVIHSNTAYLSSMSKQTEIFEFDDVDLVRRLCGSNHANLALIEDAFGVYIEAPGAAVQDPDGEAEVLGVAGVLQHLVAHRDVLAPDPLGLGRGDSEQAG